MCWDGREGSQVPQAFAKDDGSPARLESNAINGRDGGGIWVEFGNGVQVVQGQRKSFTLLDGLGLPKSPPRGCTPDDRTV